MRGIQIARYGEKLMVKNIQKPQIQSVGQMIVNICYAPVNPSDVYYVKGMYGIRKPLPTIGGFEGCGIIEEAQDKNIIGRHVMCWADDTLNWGTWANQFLVLERNTILLDKTCEDKGFAEYCSPFINPMTAVGFLDIAEKNNSQCVIINAANSAVGRMSIRLFNSRGIRTIAIVRNEEQIANLIEIGATVALSSAIPTFQTQLIATMKQLKAKTFFDAVGAEYAGLIFKNLEEKGSYISYGRFSNNKISDIDPIDLVFRQKEIKGFWLTKWIEQQSSQRFDQLKELVKTEITRSLSTRIQQIIKPNDENINEIIRLSLSNSGQGKFVLDFTQ